MTATLTGQSDGALSRAAAMVDAAHVDLTAELTRLTTDLAPGALRWDGAGARAFATALAQWSDQQRRVLAALASLREGLLGVDRLNQATDAQAATSFGGIS